MTSEKANGASNGASASELCPVSHEKAVAPVRKQLRPRKDAGLLAQFKFLRQMSKRPVPTANGDGRYSKVVVKTKLRQDLSRIGMNGM